LGLPRGRATQTVIGVGHGLQRSESLDCGHWQSNLVGASVSVPYLLGFGH
jgi:hypothetical protein